MSGLVTLAQHLAQSEPSLPALWNLVQTGGVVGVLVAALFLLVTGRLPTKKQLDDMRDERNFWRTLALNAMDLTESHIKVSEAEIPERLELQEALMGKRLAGIEAQLKALGAKRG
jgi:hypothetical protein